MSEESNQSRGWSVGRESAGALNQRPTEPHGAADRDDANAERSTRTKSEASQFTIVNARGLHVRAATKLVLLASGFPCTVVLRVAGDTASAKSVMEVLLLRAFRGTAVEVIATGERARDCVSAIGQLISSRFEDPI